MEVFIFRFYGGLWERRILTSGFLGFFFLTIGNGIYFLACSGGRRGAGGSGKGQKETVVWGPCCSLEFRVLACWRTVRGVLELLQGADTDWTTLFGHLLFRVLSELLHIIKTYSFLSSTLCITSPPPRPCLIHLRGKTFWPASACGKIFWTHSPPQIWFSKSEASFIPSNWFL